MISRVYKILLPILLSLACYSCGGGRSEPTNGCYTCGAGGPSGAVKSSLSSTSKSATASSQSSSIIPIVNRAPEFSWVFPTQNAKTTAKTITVRGIASDDRGIASIRVNNVAATFTPTAQSARLQKTNVSAVDHPPTNIQVEWEATIELSYGDVPLVVEITDTNGATADVAGKEILLRNLRMPIYLLSDPVNNRFMGSGSGSDFFYTYDNIAVDKDAKAISEIPYLNINTGSVLNADASRVYSSTLNSGLLAIAYRDVTTGVLTPVKEIDLGLDPNLWLFAMVQGAAYSPQSNVYYILVTKLPVDNTGLTESIIVQVDLDNNSHSIVTDNLIDGSSHFMASDIVFAGDKLYTLNNQFYNDNISDSIWSINLSTGARTRFGAAFDVLASHMAIDSNYRNIYVVGYENIAKINLESGELELISEDKAHFPYNLAQIRQVVVDENNQQLLIGDSSVNDVISVALNDGSRSYYIASGIGEGLKLINARQVEVNAAKTYAYILDDGGNAPARLLGIDLSNGKRTILKNFDLPYNEFANGLVLDEERQQLFTVIGTTIGRFNIETQEFDVIPSVGYVSGLVLDKINNRLIYNSDYGIVSSFNLETQLTTELFNTAQGPGPIIRGRTAMAIDTTRNQLIIKSSVEAGLYTINLETGVRALLLDSCQSGSNNLLENDTHTEINYDAASDTVLLTADHTLVTVDLSTVSCRFTPWSLDHFPLGAAQISKDIALEVSFNSLSILDFKTSQSVIISR